MSTLAHAPARQPLHQAFAAIIGRGPSAIELEWAESERQRLGDGWWLGSLRERLLPGGAGRSHVAARRLRVAASGSGEAADLTLGEGFSTPEVRSVWAAREATLHAPRPVRINLACGYLAHDATREVLVIDGPRRHRVRLHGPRDQASLVIGGRLAPATLFKADGDWVPASNGVSQDTRALAFSLIFDPIPWHTESRPERTLVNGLPSVLAAHLSRKEADSLAPIVEALVDHGFDAVSADVAAVREEALADPDPHRLFLVSADLAYQQLVAAGCRGRFVYAEHGASPIKTYTHAAHYQLYDLALLPGPLWVDRLQRLYPGSSNQWASVGYPKLRLAAPLNPQERTARCASLGLDPERPVVLFAPSWSAGAPTAGLHNLRHLPPHLNVYAIPHDADVPLADTLRREGHRVAALAAGESISDHYGWVDLLVSDISSTAVEFAALGKPVVCLASPSIADFDERHREADGRIRIPHTDRHWDFSPVVEPAQLAAAVEHALASPWTHEDTCSIRAAVQPMLDGHGREAARRCVARILEMIAEPSNEVPC